jgi:polyisoprenoid-binding protein YceI
MTERARVEIVVNAQEMRLLDSNLSPHDCWQVQMRMVGPNVLDANPFPQIRFESTTIDQPPSAVWTIDRQLTLHAHTQPRTVKVLREHGHYRGSASLKQAGFGIVPITAAGGTINVKDDLRIEFDIVTRSDPTTQR